MTPERLGLLWGITVFAGAGARLLAALSGLPGVVLLLLKFHRLATSLLGFEEAVVPAIIVSMFVNFIFLFVFV